MKETLDAFTQNILKYQKEIFEHTDGQKFANKLKTMHQRIEKGDFVGGEDQKLILGNMLQGTTGWDKKKIETENSEAGDKQAEEGKPKFTKGGTDDPGTWTT